MKAISRAITMTLGAGIFSALLVSNAFAGCGDLSNLEGPFKMARTSAGGAGVARRAWRAPIRNSGAAGERQHRRDVEGSIDLQRQHRPQSCHTGWRAD